MRPSPDQLLRILSIAREHSFRGRGLSLKELANPANYPEGRGLSLSALMDRADYRAPRPSVEASQLAAVLEANPALIDEWLAYSEDKRTSLGWGLEATEEADWLVSTLQGQSERFPSPSTACAEFVLRELDFWSAMYRGGGDRSGRGGARVCYPIIQVTRRPDTGGVS
jgi:hypothetical protein